MIKTKALLLLILLVSLLTATTIVENQASSQSISENLGTGEDASSQTSDGEADESETGCGGNPLNSCSSCYQGEGCFRNKKTKANGHGVEWEIICVPICGDGMIVNYGTQNQKEQCDDQNRDPSDGCDNCKISTHYQCQQQPSVCQNLCGNGVFDPSVGEQCDNGLSQLIDGCSNDCKIQTAYKWSCFSLQGVQSDCYKCGDGIKRSENVGFEQCDDGNRVSSDGCSMNCEIELLHKCNVVDDLSICTPTCGNNKYEPESGEECDTQDDGCSATCKIITEDNWICLNVQNEKSDCFKCGDGVKRSQAIGFEECDDGNINSEDGCDANCLIEALHQCKIQGAKSVCQKTCGNNKYEPWTGEECDNADNAGCSSSCQIEAGWSCYSVDNEKSDCYKCGDGIKRSENVGFEQCDDENNDNGDGCSQNCEIENLYVCEIVSQKSVCELSCGNNKYEPEAGEQCDTSDNGCSALCKIVTEDNWNCQSVQNEESDCYKCGDGAKRSETIGFEECDDGNINSGDGCDANCLVELLHECSVVDGKSVCSNTCGNNKYEPWTGEECDNGNDAGCSSSCQKVADWSCLNTVSAKSDCFSCGDGIKRSAGIGSEQCDDGDNNNGDGCSATCEIQRLFKCQVDSLRSFCVSTCGNDKYEPETGEECDTQQGGCSATCRIITQDGWSCNNVLYMESDCYRCGDGKIRTQSIGFEQCDTGETTSEGCVNCQIADLYLCDSEPSVCITTCGNGVFNGLTNEKCDGAAFGCSATCQKQQGYTCSNVEGVASECYKCGDGIWSTAHETCDITSEIENSSNICTANCQLNTLYTCYGGFPNCYICGNEVIEGNQECDNTDAGCTNCKADTGFVCSKDTNECSKCGNGVLDDEQICDPTASFTNSASICSQKCTLNQGYICYNSFPNCYLCGNLQLEGDEQCDVDEAYCSNCQPVDGYACVDGVCTNIANPTCGNGVIDAGEDCDGLNYCGTDCKLLYPFSCGQTSCYGTCSIENLRTFFASSQQLRPHNQQIVKNWIQWYDVFYPKYKGINAFLFAMFLFEQKILVVQNRAVRIDQPVLQIYYNTVNNQNNFSGIKSQIDGLIDKALKTINNLNKTYNLFCLGLGLGLDFV